MLTVLVNSGTDQMRVLIIPRAFRIGDEVARYKYEEAVATLKSEGWTVAYQESFTRPIEEVRMFS